MAAPQKPKNVLGLRINRDGKFLRELDLGERLTVGGAPTDHVIVAGVKGSAVLFRTGKTGEPELLLADKDRGEIGGDGEMLSFGHLKTLGLLRREGNRFVLPIQSGRSGFVQTDALRIEFTFRPALSREHVTVPKTGPGLETTAGFLDPDSRRFLRTWTVTATLLLAFMIYSFYAKVEEKQLRIEDLVRRVTKLEVPEANTVGVTAPVTTDVGAGGGGASGGGGVGEGIPTTGVIAAITTLGPGSGRSIADMLGAGGRTGDMDALLSGIGGLKGAGGAGGIGGGLGAGGAGGTGLGGGADGLAGLAGGFGPGGSGGKLVKKSVSVSASAPSSVGGTGAGDKNRSASVIASVIRSHLAGIQNAYNTALKQNPNLGGGKIVVRFTIASTGTVTSASIISDSVGCASLASSVVSRIRSWRFPTIQTGDVTVVYPFVFVAQEG